MGAHPNGWTWPVVECLLTMLAPSKADVISSVWTLKTGERLRLLGALPARLARHSPPVLGKQSVVVDAVGDGCAIL